VEPSAALRLFFPDTTTAADRDRLVALLAESGLLAIQEDDVVRPSSWIAHFADEVSRDAALSLLHHSDFAHLRVESLTVEDEDWARRTQADLPAIRIGRIVVAPPWDVPSTERWPPSAEPRAPSAERRAPSPEKPIPMLAGPHPRSLSLGDSAPRSGRRRSADVIVIIEPSRGFGTGHHQSTRLCLALLQSRDLGGRTVIDVGTGSGVLAIAAARLGAAYVSAIDVDPDAIENARENVARNDIGGIVEAHVDDLSSTTLAPADVVTANLTGSLIEEHASTLTRLVRPGGSLIAAGFTVDDRERVAAAFAPHLCVVESAEEDDWCGFVLG
jgi:ribosomal protein L11 methyltransferase